MRTQCQRLKGKKNRVQAFHLIGWSFPVVVTIIGLVPRQPLNAALDWTRPPLINTLIAVHRLVNQFAGIVLFTAYDTERKPILEHVEQLASTVAFHNPYAFW